MASDLDLVRELAFGDLERELKVTRIVLERLPEDRYDWQPHEKSMSLGRLALHVAQLPDWERATLETRDFDAANSPRPPAKPENRAHLRSYFDTNVAALRKAVAAFNLSDFTGNWTIRNGAHVMNTSPRTFVHRVWCLNHMIHHRGQLCLYLRLLNVPVPAVYFNSSDEPDWVFT